MDFYSISLKRCEGTKIKYGQQQYNFDEGLMFFLAPGQVLHIEAGESMPSGWLLLIHPDFLWNTSLASTIKTYDYFGYVVMKRFSSQKKRRALLQI